MGEAGGTSKQLRTKRTELQHDGSGSVAQRWLSCMFDSCQRYLHEEVGRGSLALITAIARSPSVASLEHSVRDAARSSHRLHATDRALARTKRSNEREMCSQPDTRRSFRMDAPLSGGCRPEGRLMVVTPCPRPRLAAMPAGLLGAEGGGRAENAAAGLGATVLQRRKQE